MFIEKNLLHVTLNNITILLIMLEMRENRFFIIKDFAGKNASKAEISQLMFRNLKWNATISGSGRPGDVINITQIWPSKSSLFGIRKCSCCFPRYPSSMFRRLCNFTQRGMSSRFLRIYTYGCTRSTKGKASI